MSVLADTFGPLDGRSPDPRQMSEMSAEVGYVSEGDFSSLSTRLNYQYSPLLTLYGDLALVDLNGNADGNAFGFGARYYLANQRIVPELDLAVRASYHLSNVEFNSFASTDLDISEFSMAVHFGGKEAFYENGLKWYGVISYNRVATETTVSGISTDNSDSDIGFGGGVYMPLGPGEVYVGVENIDDMYFGLGYRHFLGDASY